MATVTETTTLEIIGEHLREARADIHGLKTHIMAMEDRQTERFDSIEQKLEKIMDHLGIE